MPKTSPPWYRPIVAGDRFAVAWWVTLVVAITAVLLLRSHLSLDQFVTARAGFWLFAVLVIFWDLRPIMTSGGYDPYGVNLSTAFVFAAMMRWGLGPALVIMAAGTLTSELTRRKPPIISIFNVAQYSISYIAAWLVLVVAGIAPVLGTTGMPTTGNLPVLVLAGAAYHFTNLFVVSCLLATRSGRSLRVEFLDEIGYYTATTAAVLAMAPLLVVLVEVEWSLVLLLLPPLVAVHRTAAMSVRQEHLSQHDVLTGLANRKRLEAVVNDAIRVHPQPGALILLDLDRFKQVNDTLGHQAGDQLLVEVARRLQDEMREGDVVSRLGGDEFAVWLASASRGHAVDVAGRLRERLQAPFELPTMIVDVDASVGIARFPDDGDTLEELLRCADVAMYAAKDASTGVELYDSSRDHNTVSRLELVAELRRGLAAGELVLHYQPKISFCDRTIVGVEALVRWAHPTRGLLPPVEFLGLAEQAGLMREVTDVVVTQALAQAARWRDIGLNMPVAVNITPRDLADARFAMMLSTGLARHDLGPELLQLEVTEHTLMDALGVESRVAAIAELGLSLSLDDFGTGYSSLTHLRRLPVTELKIDRSFVLEVHDSDAIVRSIVQLAHNLGLTTVAEGVETAEDWRVLREIGCDVAQGYLFSRPLPADQATDCLARGKLGPAVPGTVLSGILVTD